MSTLTLSGDEKKQKQTQRDIDQLIKAYRFEGGAPRSRNAKLDLQELILHNRIPLSKQMRVLSKRSLMVQLRNPLLTKARLGQTIGPGLILGWIFAQLPLSQAGAQDRLGAMFIVLANATIIPMISVTTTFPGERALFLRERADGIYSTFAYWFSKTMADFPAQIVFPLIFSVLTYFIMGFVNDAAHFFWYVCLSRSNLISFSTCAH